MKKIMLSAILLTGCLQISFAQTDATTTHEKTVDQYIGVQINELIQQIFNFSSGNASTVANNPYLLNYSINSHKTGWGARIGIGYNYNSSSTDDGITSTTTKLNDMELRVGVEKRFNISKKWSAGAGLDFVYNSNDDHTVNVINSTFGGENTDTKTNISSSGGGPMGWLRYHLTDKILIGTEASFYYTSGNEKQTIIVSDPNTGGGFPNPPTTTNTSNKVGLGTFSSPVVFFLSVKF